MENKKEISPDMKAFMKELLESMKHTGYSKYMVTKDNPQGKTDGLSPETLEKILMKIAKTGEIEDDNLAESLRDWFKKEDWVRITTSGDIAGPCGTSKNKKNPDRCLPRAKAQSMTKAERAATAQKKKRAGAKGKQVVPNTKKAKVTRETANPQDGKAAPYGSGYSKVTKEDIHNFVVGVLQEKTGETIFEDKDDRCTRIAKRKYDTWPSAYASGAVVRCRRGDIWKNEK